MVHKDPTRLCCKPLRDDLHGPNPLRGKTVAMTKESWPPGHLFWSIITHYELQVFYSVPRLLMTQSTTKLEVGYYYTFTRFPVGTSHTLGPQIQFICIFILFVYLYNLGQGPYIHRDSLRVVGNACSVGGTRSKRHRMERSINAKESLSGAQKAPTEVQNRTSREHRHYCRWRQASV